MNQTYGFQLLLKRESPRILFNILMTRDLDHSTLKGIVFDHACGKFSQEFILNLVKNFRCKSIFDES